jgi:hypothetical protein
MFRFIFDASLRLLKKCRNISVGISPRKSKETADMKTAALRAERDFETGKCFSEADFKERFVKWL